MIKKLLFFFAVIGLGIGEFAFAQGIWAPAKPMPIPRAGIAAVTRGNKIYVLGGKTQDGSIVSTVDVYDPGADTWNSDFPPMKKPLENAAAIVFHDTLFVLGGRDDEGHVLNKVTFFDFAKSEWKSFEDMLEERQGHAAIVIDGFMYAIGGSKRKDELLNDVEYYDPRRKKWREADDWELVYPSASLGAVVVDDSAFAIGGFSSFGPLGSVQRYHPGVGTAEKASLLLPRGGLVAVVFQGEILAIGGRDQSDQVVSSMEVYNFSENAWQVGSALNIARENFAAVATDGAVYVFGGRGINGDTIAEVEMFEEPSTGIDDSHERPVEFALQQNYPNPFNAGTTIRFQIGSSNRFSPTKLSIFSIDGKLVRTLVNEPLAAGEHRISWDATDNQGNAVTSGVYLYVLQVGSQRQTKKMSLIQ